MTHARSVGNVARWSALLGLGLAAGLVDGCPTAASPAGAPIRPAPAGAAARGSGFERAERGGRTAQAAPAAVKEDRSNERWHGWIRLTHEITYDATLTPHAANGWLELQKSERTRETLEVYVSSRSPGAPEQLIVESGTLAFDWNEHEFRRTQPPSTLCGQHDVRRPGTLSESRQDTVLVESCPLAGARAGFSFVRRDDVPDGEGLEARAAACGADVACLTALGERLAAELQDGADDDSYPVLVGLDVEAPCRGTSRVTDERRRRDACGSNDDHDEPETQTLELPLASPLVVQALEGTFRRERNGEVITASPDSTPERTLVVEPGGAQFPRIERTWGTVVLRKGPPEVRLFLVRGEELEDVTNRSVDVLIGERIELHAIGLSADHQELRDHDWHVEGSAIADWEGSLERGTTTPFEPPAATIASFVWVDGSTSGARRAVRYEGTLGGLALDGRTEFVVHEPSVAVQVTPSTFVGFGGAADSDCELTPASPSLRLQATATMPAAFAGRTGCLEFVQLAETNCWTLKREYTAAPLYSWYKSVDGELLDTSYPYRPAVCGQGTLADTMSDTPGLPLSQMVSGFADMRFRAFLLFRPTAGEDPAPAAWVPLGVVAWSWSGSTSFRGDPQQDPWPSCQKRYQPPACPHPVSDSNPRWTETATPPTWTGYHVRGPLTETMQTTTNAADQPPVSGGWGCR